MTVQCLSTAIWGVSRCIPGGSTESVDGPGARSSDPASPRASAVRGNLAE